MILFYLDQYLTHMVYYSFFVTSENIKENFIVIKNKNSKLAIPHCPACGSTDIENISTLNRAVSTAMVDIASSKIGKQFHCKNCGYDF